MSKPTLNKHDFTVDISVTGYMIKYQGHRIGGIENHVNNKNLTPDKEKQLTMEYINTSNRVINSLVQWKGPSWMLEQLQTVYDFLEATNVETRDTRTKAKK